MEREPVLGARARTKATTTRVVVVSSYDTPNQESTGGSVDRVTVQALEDIPTFEGADGRTYDLRENDIITLPRRDANRLLADNLTEVIRCRS